MSSSGLARFKSAQDDAVDGFAAALAELKAGAKRGHWIWYVFPQLAGLGRSPMSQQFAIRDLEEATAYAREPELLSRLLEVCNVVAEQLAQGAALTTLMGGHVDALKLVSSLTLFEVVAERLQASDGQEAHRTLVRVTQRILAAAEAQGYLRCRHTLRSVARPQP